MPVPLSQGGSIALLSDENTACVIDSYEVRVHCVDRSGEVVGVFGREGEGPGEFGGLIWLVGGKDNRVGTVDHELRRFSVFEPSGVLVTEVALPDTAVTMTPIRRFSTTIAGISLVIHIEETQAGPRPVFNFALYEVDMASGEVLGERVPQVEAEVECGSILYGFPNPVGGWVHVACEGHMVFVAPEGSVGMLQAPTYTRELPNERDMEWWEEVVRPMRRVRGRSDLEERERFGNTPKNYHLVFGEQKFDDQGRLWIATQRDRDEFSYLDVYDPAEAAFVASVQISDRVRGFDLLGSTLVVVVERQLAPDDPVGIADRAVDWYDVSEVR